MLDESDDLGQTPLHLAAKQGLLKLTNAILSAYKVRPVLAVTSLVAGCLRVWWCGVGLGGARCT